MPQSVATPQDLSSLILEVKDYAVWYTHEAVKQKFSAKAQDSQPVLSHASSEMIRNWFGSKPATRSGFDGLIKALEKYKQGATHITVTLAAPAPNSLRTMFIEWFRNNLSANVLITFEINTAILGGMVVRHESRVYDWSFRSKLIDAKMKFPEVLRRV